MPVPQNRSRAMHRKSLANSFTMTLTALAIVGCGKSEKPDAEVPPPVAQAEPAPAAAPAEAPATPSTGTETMGLTKTDLKVGTGAEIKSGQNALVHYTGWLYDEAAPEHKGKQFDSSVGGEPFDFPLGGGRVIAG